MIGLPLPLVKRQVSEDSGEGERKGVAELGEGVLPVLQHGLYQLRLRI